ncbi:hypothetical protein M8C21_022894, partial [Ambrosia artemisiifolia]
LTVFNLNGLPFIMDDDLDDESKDVDVIKDNSKSEKEHLLMKMRSLLLAIEDDGGIEMISKITCLFRFNQGFARMAGFYSKMKLRVTMEDGVMQYMELYGEKSKKHSPFAY